MPPRRGPYASRGGRRAGGRRRGCGQGVRPAPRRAGAGTSPRARAPGSPSVARRGRSVTPMFGRSSTAPRCRASLAARGWSRPVAFAITTSGCSGSERTVRFQQRSLAQRQQARLIRRLRPPPYDRRRAEVAVGAHERRSGPAALSRVAGSGGGRSTRSSRRPGAADGMDARARGAARELALEANQVGRGLGLHRRGKYRARQLSWCRGQGTPLLLFGKRSTSDPRVIGPRTPPPQPSQGPALVD